MSHGSLNLLPWRQREAARRRRVYLAVLVSCAVVPGLARFVTGLDTRMEVSEVRAQVSTYAKASQAASELSGDTALLARQIEDLEAWLVELDQLEDQRGMFGALWHELAAELPDSMHFSGLLLEGLRLEVQGFTTSSPDLASYLRRLETASAIESPRLIDLEDESGGKRFGVLATLKILHSER